jgi:helicase
MKHLVNLGLPEAVLNVLRADGITDLYPPQAESIEPALMGKNLVLAIPTASGKSLVAYLAIVKSVLTRGGKALYIVPLRALAAEKYEDLKHFETLGISVGLTIGDYDSPDLGLGKNDVIIATSERADSLLRHRLDWLGRISVLVVDEVHMMNDPSRGPTLEVIISKFRKVNPALQVIALSATIQNSDEIAEWLGAVHIQSEWRPVELRPGVHFKDRIRYLDGSTKKTGNDIGEIVKTGLEEGGQCLVFVNTRRNAESQASALCAVVEPVLSLDEKGGLKKAANRILRGETTAFARKLADLLKRGSVFHHAGLTNGQRRSVEQAFKNRLVKVIVATPTLAAGINLPARTVIVRDLKRWDGAIGRQMPIPVMEIQQMLGRAGRPRFDTTGEGILLARSRSESDSIMEEVIDAEPERIESKLGVEGALRSHILSSVATGFTRSEADILEFMESTFYAYQRELWTIEDQVRENVEFLIEHELLRSPDGAILEATKFGKRVSDLYIDPKSAIIIRSALNFVTDKDRDFPNFSFLHVACSTPDLEKVSGYIRKAEMEWLEEILIRRKHALLVPFDDEYPELFEDELRRIKTASMLEDWINEKREDDMLDFYSLGPGDIRNRVETAKWIVYSMSELAKILGSGYTKQLRTLERRLRHGISEELLDLCALRGVGRVRARKLYENGYKTWEDLKRAKVSDLSALPAIGKGVAEDILAQVNLDKKGEPSVDAMLEEWM